MTDTSIYNDIATRTGGDIYIGVVGPVRTGKSTFIRKFMETAVLPNIKEEYELFIQTLLDYKQNQKLLTAFIQKLPNEVKEDGCIHGRFNSLGTATGRFSSSDPK